MQKVASLGQQPQNAQLIFTVPHDVGYIRFNPPLCNKECAVLTLNVDHSFPPKGIFNVGQILSL